jgi:hypothetical protein
MGSDVYASQVITRGRTGLPHCAPPLPEGVGHRGQYFAPFDPLRMTGRRGVFREAGGMEEEHWRLFRIED